VDQFPDNSAAKDAAERAGTQDTDAPVLIFEAVSSEEADVVLATLQAEGIMAVLQSADVNPVLGSLHSPNRDTAALGIYVPPSQAEAARAILSAPAPTEEELARAAEADPRTLEQAEADVKNV
jgi:hypothetical protein